MNQEFVENDVLSRLASLTQAEADKLSYGAVKVDSFGVIEIFNQHQMDMSGFQLQDVLGKNFFTEIAPCTNNRLFYGKFKTGVENGELLLKLPYTFTYRMRPTNVFIQIHVDKPSQTNWIFIKRR